MERLPVSNNEVKEVLYGNTPVKGLLNHAQNLDLDDATNSTSG